MGPGGLLFGYFFITTPKDNFRTEFDESAETR